MILKNIPFALVLTLMAAFIVSCGENDNYSKERDAWVTRKMMEEKYGSIGGTKTETQTIVQVTHVTITTTVNAQ